MSNELVRISVTLQFAAVGIAASAFAILILAF